MIPYNLLARGCLWHYITLVRREAELGDADPDLRDLQEARVNQLVPMIGVSNAQEKSVPSMRVNSH